jgi:cytochrome c
MQQLLRSITDNFTFHLALVVMGGLMATAVVFDLSYRGLQRNRQRLEWSLDNADPDRGREAIVQYGCVACHVIPGIRQATGRVGPQLNDFANQLFIAGVLPNTEPNLVSWIQDPQRINPLTAMPTLDVTSADARDIAAYLYSVD